MHLLSSDPLAFPPAELASPEGLLAVGGDLRSERLVAAYRRGIFPWYNRGQPILWWSPDPRAVLYPDKLRVSRSLRKTINKGEFRVTMDEAFADVIGACAHTKRGGSGGTWITPEMNAAYRRLHEEGLAHSVEAWMDDELAGGLYGVSLGRAFFGESMFTHRTDASKVAFVYLVRQLERWQFAFVDCQLSSNHLFSLGAEEIPRSLFLEQLGAALHSPDRRGRWRFDNVSASS